MLSPLLRWIVLLGVGIAFLAFPFWLYHDYTGFFGYQPRYLICLEQLRAGTLYGDTPFCGDPPVFFLLSLPVYLFARGAFQEVIRGLILVLNLSLVLLLYRAAQRDRISVPWLLLLLYIPFIYVQSLFQLDSLLATVFLFAGFYLFRFSRVRGRFVLAGSLYALALFSKPSAAPPLAALFLFSLLSQPSLDTLKRLGITGSPILVTGAALLYFFPHALQYAVLAHSAALPSLPWSTIAVPMLHLFSLANVSDLVLACGLLLSGYMVYKYRDVYAFASLLGLSLMFVLLFRNSGIETRSLGFLYYFLPTYPFLLMTAQHFWTKLSSKAVGSLVVLVIVFPYYQLIYVEEQVVDLQRLVGDGLTQLPVDHGTILQNFEKPPLLRARVGPRVQAYGMEAIGAYDWVHGPGLQALGLVNLSAWQHHELVAKLPPVLQQIRSGVFEAIVLDPQGERTQLFKAIRLADAGDHNVPYTCAVYVPTIEERCYACPKMRGILLKDEQQCAQFRRGLLAYYAEHFDDICDKDERVANEFITDVLHYQGLPFPRTCTSGRRLLDRYERRNRFLPLPTRVSEDRVEDSSGSEGLRKITMPGFGLLLKESVFDGLSRGEERQYCLQCRGRFCEVYNQSNLLQPLGAYYCTEADHEDPRQLLDFQSPLQRTGFLSTPCYEALRTIQVMRSTSEARALVPDLCSPATFTLEGQAPNILYYQPSLNLKRGIAT